MLHQAKLPAQSETHECWVSDNRDGASVDVPKSTVACMNMDGNAALAYGFRCIDINPPPEGIGEVLRSKVVLISKEPKAVEAIHPLLVASKPEDCARLLCIAHSAGQRFDCPIQLLLPGKVLEYSLNVELEHIPLPPPFILRGRELVDNRVRDGHPALSFFRLSHGIGRGPRNKSKFLVVSHGSDSERVESIVNSTREVNAIRHLSLQTLIPFPTETLATAVAGTDTILVLTSTSPWLPNIPSAEEIDIEHLQSRLER